VIKCREQFLNKNALSNVLALEAEVAKDPYLVACLRGGSRELIQVALIALLERGLLKAQGNKLKAAADATDKVRRPLDKAILRLYKKASTGKAAFDDVVVLSEVDKIHERLREMALLPKVQAEPFRIHSGYAAVGFLWLVALVKIIIALGRGRYNIGFLVIMAIIFVPIAAVMICSRGSSTYLGKHVLNKLHWRFASLGNRSSLLQFNGQTGDVAFYAAIFGLSGLPPAITSIIEPLELIPPPPQPSSGSDSSSSSHSSCSSSCGGGGGCGGCG
jgi:uncharacterized protein (TIGR04222 family)